MRKIARVVDAISEKTMTKRKKLTMKVSHIKMIKLAHLSMLTTSPLKATQMKQSITTREANTRHNDSFKYQRR